MAEPAAAARAAPAPGGVLALVALAMAAFAANSLLCRLALKQTGIDPASFTTLRLISGAVTLAALAALRGSGTARGGILAAGSWRAATALFLYAAGFSYAYVTLGAGTGALLLFGAVQLCMLGCGLAAGERLSPAGLAGMVLAACGLVVLVAPGVTAPPWQGAALMLAAGAGWAAYSLLGRRAVDPLATTAANFLRAVPFALACSAVFADRFRVDAAGALYAVLSGALASGLGYALWYAVLPRLSAIRAATVQLSVPVLAALAGAALLGEAISLRAMLASACVLGGIALVLRSRSASGR